MSSLLDIPPEIDWCRLSDPPETVGIGPEGWGGRLAFAIPWGYRYSFLDLVAGLDETITYAGGSTMVRKVPLRHPERPDVFFAIGAECEGWGGPEGFLDGVGQEVLYSHARVTVDFSTGSFGSGEEVPFSVTRIRHGSEYITKPGSAFVYSNGTKSSQDSGLFIATNTISITTYLNPTLNHPQLTSLTNKINSTTFLGYPAGHVRFDGADTESPVSSLGARTHTKSMTFTYRQLHWNVALRGDGMFDTPVSSYDGLPAFQSANLNVLIQ